MKKIGSLFLALLAPVALAQPAQDFSAVQEIVHELADGLYYLEGSGGNIGVSVGDDGVFLIDDQYAPLTEKIIAAVATLSDKPIRFVFNTHHHGDHTGGNQNLVVCRRFQRAWTECSWPAASPAWRFFGMTV